MPTPEQRRCERCADLVTDARCCERCARSLDGPAFSAVVAAYDPARVNPIYHFFYGIRLFLAAIPFTLRTRGVKRHIAAPILITLALFAGLVAVVVALVAWRWGGSPDDTGLERAGQTLVAGLFVGATIVLTYLLFFPLARVLLAPFADKISERVEEVALGTSAPTSFALERAAGDTLRSIVEAIKMLSLQLLVTLPLLVLLPVPVVGQVLPAIASVFFGGLGALDITMGRKRMRLGEKLRLAGRNLSLVLGLGTAVYVLLFVPGLNLLAIPFGAVAGTHAFLRVTAAREQKESPDV